MDKIWYDRPTQNHVDSNIILVEFCSALSVNSLTVRNEQILIKLPIGQEFKFHPLQFILRPGLWNSLSVISGSSEVMHSTYSKQNILNKCYNDQ
jgi:hypothetical protein